MRRLIESGLMFGGMVHVDSPVLVERYNRALERLIGKRTKLDDFHIDLSGFAPEIGDELQNPNYLNANGCNRQFILLGVEQKRAPLLNMTFSSARPILRDWIEANEAALFALTARDAVVGELVNSVFDVSTPSDLLDIRQITVEADTTDAHVADAAALADRIERFRTEPDAWLDDVLIAEMIGLAKRTGDVTRTPIELQQGRVAHGNFWTRLFGGAYVFATVPKPFIVARAPDGFRADPALGCDVLGLDDAVEIARALRENGLSQAIVGAPGVDAAAILRQKMAFILVDAAATREMDLHGTDLADLRGLARKMGSGLPEAFAGLAELVRYVETGGTWPQISPVHPAYFYALRGQPGPDRDVVNMLLAELTPLDPLQLFICHKELFYATYRGWSAPRQALIADYLQRAYMSDKPAMRETLFGDAEEAAPAPRRPGPWG
ncbi:hypothetical protein ILP92_06150 [Maribius pontilimi]|uniref:Uncharacterized protein n=1 Tax=Palleronia pontilimi TaxID=1964209 RepID=A0A934IB02_9RHOB|nr:hypothetical protein [Palleronia pontilimi]